MAIVFLFAVEPGRAGSPGTAVAPKTHFAMTGKRKALVERTDGISQIAQLGVDRTLQTGCARDQADHKD